MSIRDEVRYKKAVLQKEIPEYEELSQNLVERAKTMQRDLEVARQWKEAIAKMPAPADPTQASNVRYFDTCIAIFLAAYAQVLTTYDVVIEMVEDTKEVLRILKSVSAEEVTEEELRQAFADVSKIKKSIDAKKSILYEAYKTLKDACKAFVDAYKAFMGETSDKDTDEELFIL